MSFFRWFHDRLLPAERAELQDIRLTLLRVEREVAIIRRTCDQALRVALSTEHNVTTELIPQWATVIRQQAETVDRLDTLALAVAQRLEGLDLHRGAA